MHGIELTYHTLARTRNEAAIDVLRLALLDEDRLTRRCALQALLGRSEHRCRYLVLAHWQQLQADEVERIRKQRNWLEPAISERLRADGPDVGIAVAAARQLELVSAIPAIVNVAESSSRESIRDEATEAVLAMTEPLGQDARMDRDRPTLRGPAVHRLAESVSRFAEHGNARLLDAFLGVVTWGDSELRNRLHPESTASETLLLRMATSEISQVLELLVGFIRRRNLPDEIVRILAERKDGQFRAALLRTIGSEPCETVLRNLKRIGMPACCHDGEPLLQQLQPGGRAALAHLAVATHTDPARAMHLVCGVIERGGTACEQAAASALGRCEVPDIELWMRAAGILADGDPERIRRHENAALLQRLIRLLEHANPAVVRSARRILMPLHAEQVLARFDSLRARSRRRLGRVVQMVDPTAVERVREKLRHPVLAQRLEAIAAADALAAVDRLADAFKPIARADHQEARRRAALVLADAEGEETLSILREMAELPDSTVRDTAVESLRRRESRMPIESFEQEHLQDPTDFEDAPVHDLELGHLESGHR